MLDGLHPVVLFLIQLGAVAGAITAILVAIERIWAPMKKWLQDALTNPILEKMTEIDANLRERDDVLKEELVHLREEFEEHVTYVGKHLGSGDAPLHERVHHLEDRVEQHHPS